MRGPYLFFVSRRQPTVPLKNATRVQVQKKETARCSRRSFTCRNETPLRFTKPPGHRRPCQQTDRPHRWRALCQQGAGGTGKQRATDDGPRAKSVSTLPTPQRLSSFWHPGLLSWQAASSDRWTDRQTASEDHCSASQACQQRMKSRDDAVMTDLLPPWRTWRHGVRE